MSEDRPLYEFKAPTPKCWCERCDVAEHGYRSRMHVCPICGDKRCPRAAHHEAACNKPEDRPLYEVLDELAAELSEFAPPTVTQIVDRMRTLSSEMMRLGTDMQYIGGFGKVAKIGTAMHIGASKLRTWAHEIEEAQG